MRAKKSVPQFSSLTNDPDSELHGAQIEIVRGARLGEPTEFSGRYECLRHSETFHSAADAQFHSDLLGCDVFPVFTKAQIN